MIQKIVNFIARLKGENSGQTALILILLTAAALIFLSITLNWGRIAQVKGLLTIAADTSATGLASDAASYGEEQKQTYLQNANFKSSLTGVLLSVIVLIIAIICQFIPGLQAAGIYLAFAIIGMVMTFVTIVLQLVWIGPMVSQMWNKLQKNQPIQQQFYEQTLAAALQGAVTDQVNVTDYFDWNANGKFGLTGGLPNDTAGRFAIFYTDRLKMLNQPDIPAVVFFYNQLGELMNGTTCAQNASDNNADSSIPLNPSCPADCLSNPSDPACQLKIPNGFQLNDPCIDSDPTSPTYNPYCDPCCQLLSQPNPMYCNPSTTSSTTSSSSSTTACTGTTSSGAACNCNPLVSQYTSLRPSNCDQSASPAQCLTNNPYGTTSANPYTLLYDPTYQEYANNLSFLDMFGRDQQMGPFTSSLTPQGNFPNGIYPFFWLMNEYSPEVDNINPTVAVSPAQAHWCVAGGTIPSSGTAPPGFTDLTQLGQAPYTLPYACVGQDCCVNYLANSVNASGVPALIATGGANVVIDAVGSGSNPAQDSSFGETGTTPTTLWQPGDNQMCLSTWPYNGSTTSIPDGTCEWTGTANPPSATPAPAGPTMDSVDDTMHTLSDFTVFANSLLGQSLGTLSSTFDTWYPQAAAWIAPACGGAVALPACNGGCLNSDGTTSSCPSGGQCSDGSACSDTNGRLLSIFNPYTGFDELGTWNTVISNWLKNTYTASASGSPWCVPPATTGFAIEDNLITNNGTVAWGTLPSIINCLNFNAIAPANNYQACQTALPNGSSCPSTLPLACAAATLGRSLVSGAVPVFNGNCDPTVPGSYAKWVSDSLTLAKGEAPKFALRAAFLNDIYTRAQTMQNIFSLGDAEIKNFMNGPAAQLITARSQTEPTANLPNAVIYGWVDKVQPNGQGGYAHVVKVTAYGPARNGSSANGTTNSIAQPLLPWIKTTMHLFTRDFELRNRDGYVYVSVKRWDQDHSNSLLFPNGRPLWQFLFHNPKGSTNTSGFPAACVGPGGFGFGLEPNTVAGLQGAGMLATDQTYFSQAFMLNDEGTGAGEGQVDPSAKTNNSNYLSCLSWANQMLSSAPESHACVEYVASSPASNPGSVTSGVSSRGDADYALKFVDCKSVPGYPPPDDLAYSSGG